MIVDSKFEQLLEIDRIGAVEGLPTMTAMRKTVERIAARVLGILTLIMIWRVRPKAKVIEFYIPRNFRKILKSIPEVQRGKIVEFGTQTKRWA
jgi:hypothetical protein